MTTKRSFLLSLLSLLFFFFLHHSQAQDGSPNTTGYTCSANQSSSTYPCHTYAFYRTREPKFLDLRSIADLFSVNPVQIAEANNITFSYDIFAPNQPLFVPISCSCNFVAGNLTPNSNDSLSYNEFNPSPNTTTSISYANITYTIGGGDTFFLLSTVTFQNLTTYYSVEIVNPDLVPTNLSIVATANVPVFCKCPNRNQSNFLITYVIQPEDYLTSVASFFGSSANSIVEVNGNNFEPYTVGIPENSREFSVNEFDHMGCRSRHSSMVGCPTFVPFTPGVSPIYIGHSSLCLDATKTPTIIRN